MVTRSENWRVATVPSRTEEWETPPELFARYDAEFGFTLDAAASASNRKCETYYSRADDALSQPWRGVVWLNPPYGRGVARWMAKASEAARQGATVVCLVPARTDTAWWHTEVMGVASEIRYLRGRVRYIREDGYKNTAPFASAIVIYRPPNAAECAA